MVIFEAFDVAGRAVRARSEQVCGQTAFLLEIETADRTQTAALSPSEALTLGRALVLHATTIASGDAGLKSGNAAGDAAEQFFHLPAEIPLLIANLLKEVSRRQDERSRRQNERRRER